MTHKLLFLLGVAVLGTGCTSSANTTVDLKPDSVAREEWITQRVSTLDQKIESITFYGIAIDAVRKFSYQTQKGRQHAFVAIKAGGKTGWCELNYGSAENLADGELFKYRCKNVCGFAEQLKGKTIPEALEHVAALRDKANRAALENFEIALLDLAGKLINKPSVELLGLPGNHPIPGLYCILSDQPGEVEIRARNAYDSHNLKTHLKVKLYGRPDVDVAIIKAARSVYGESAYIVGDVNMGYNPKKLHKGQKHRDVDEIVSCMRKLKQAGLSGCEDPAEMPVVEWEKVQSSVPELDLVPDVPLRPSWRALDQISKDMGRVFNMHPHCMGSIIQTVDLGLTIQSWDRKLMVGDASLVGPSCAPWIHLACGLNADWVEAIPKPDENSVYQQCLTLEPFIRDNKGRFKRNPVAVGFGVELDEKKLTSLAFISLSSEEL